MCTLKTKRGKKKKQKQKCLLNVIQFLNYFNEVEYGIFGGQNCSMNDFTCLASTENVFFILFTDNILLN